MVIRSHHGPVHIHCKSMKLLVLKICGNQPAVAARLATLQQSSLAISWQAQPKICKHRGGNRGATPPRRIVYYAVFEGGIYQQSSAETMKYVSK